ncbi:hypothetical protein JXO52_15670 [bacterium]|nr:hypothetical protein [bacterium]
MIYRFIKKCPVLLFFITVWIGCAHLKEAHRQYADGNYRESIRLCSAAVAADSSDIGAWILLSRSYRAADSLQQAYRTVTGAAAAGLTSGRLSSETGLVYTAMGNSAAAEGDLLRALAHYRKAETYVQEETQLLIPFTETLLQAGRLGEAAEKAALLRRIGIDTVKTAAFAAEIASRRASASKQADKGIDAYSKEKFDTAVNLLSHARELQSDNETINYYFHMATGSDLYLKGRYTYKQGAVGTLWDAIEHFGKAASLRPEEAEPHYRMALCYEKKDRDEYVNAIAAYEKAVKLEPDGPFAAASRKQITALKERKEKMDRFYGRTK